MARQIATTITVSKSELTEFVRPRHRMIVITQRSDGSPQASPVTGGVDDSGRIVISTYPERAKTANARRRPEVTVLVLSDDFGGAWVQVDGTCEVLDVPDSVEPLVEYFRNISGEHPDWEEYRTAMVEQGKSLIRVTPTRWGPIATGGVPARLADQPGGADGGGFPSNRRRVPAGMLPLFADVPASLTLVRHGESLGNVADARARA